ncbi:histidine phosphatase family protein [Nesterenkonia alba]|uniref:histidine phosphatase family protein n=1 Tax=Nesterenkonia alba TaxID=515814 RepID=UPI0003B5D6BF|nr:histidine phosphatase family protein [Nesterenkonia alba]
MIRVLLVRHGETQWNAEGRMQGRTDIPLSEAGLTQSTLAGGLIRGQNPTQGHVSTLQRTHQTFEAFELGFAPSIWDELCEMGFGEWEGRRGAELRDEQPELFTAMRSGQYTPPGGETNEEVTERMRRAFFAAVRATAETTPTPSVDLGFEVRTTVLVSHGSSLRLLLRSLGLVQPHWWVPLTNASTTFVDIRLHTGPVSSTLPKAGLGDDLSAEDEAQIIRILSDQQIQNSARLRLFNLSPELLNPEEAPGPTIR